MKTTYISLIDPPRVARDGEVIENERFISQGPILGRVLFVEPSPCIFISGVALATIRDCYFEVRP